MMRYAICLNLICLYGIISGQNAVSKEIHSLTNAGLQPREIDLLQFETTDIHHRSNKLSGLKKGTIMSLEQKAIQTLFLENNDFISLSIPLKDRSDVVVTLKRHEIFTSDFAVYTSSNPDMPFEYKSGLHYRGVVADNDNSIVAISVFHDQIMGLIGTDAGNFVLGPIKGDTEQRHVFYNDRDLDLAFDFVCSTEDDGLGYTKEQLKPLPPTRDLDDCVRLYLEINHDIVNAMGGAIPATDHFTGIFNQSFVLFANEEITFQISEIKVWTSTSPYTGSSSSQMLSSFRANTEFFNGDLGHLVSFDSTYGGVAGLNGICNLNPDASKCFSGIRFHYELVPIFSRPVYLVTHEMGHLLGSRHTHACAWNGNNTAIDGCAGVVEGDCPLPGLPPNGGTIMSYCNNSNSGSFVDLNLGFGPQPGVVIRNTVNAAGNCLTPCGQPTSYCPSYGVNSTSDYINKVVLGSINNTSGNNGGYADYTSLSTNLQAGNTYTITLSPKPQNGNHSAWWRIWIDYNNDFDWYDAGEIVAQGAGKNPVNIPFTVPSNSPGTTTRMRVSMEYGSFPNFCETFPFGEVEDYTVVIIPNTPTCSDGVQNQGETDIDCGGPCPACPTCTDGIQNQGETSIDCGGPCSACETSDSTILLGAYFETGWDSWIDGGPDVNRVNSSNSFEGLYSIRLADNSGVQSAMTSPAFDLSNVVGLQISFHFYASSMETGEDFWVRYNNGSGNWVTVGTYTSGTTFNNNTHYASTITIPNFATTSAGSLRIQCDASDNNDQVFIDAVVITALNGSEFIESGMTLLEVNPSAKHALSSEESQSLFVYPNPVEDVLNISFDGEIQSMRLISIDGREIEVSGSSIETKQLNISALASGLYFLLVVDDSYMVITSKFMKR